LSEVAAEADEKETLDRVGRLIGVTMKQPLAEPQPVDTPTITTRAYRQWELKDEKTILDTEQNTWQYQTLAALSQDEQVIESLGYQPPSVYGLAVDAHHERGFFAILTVSCRKYLCSEPKLREEISNQIEDARRAGIDIRNVTPETIVAVGGAAVGTVLIQSIPILGLVGTPVIAGLLVIIYKIGMHAFCQWAQSSELRSDLASTDATGQDF